MLLLLFSVDVSVKMFTIFRNNNMLKKRKKKQVKEKFNSDTNIKNKKFLLMKIERQTIQFNVRINQLVANSY